MDDPRVGSVLDGRYRIDARLAAGGTGVVYDATQLGLQRSVAIKFLHQSSAQSSTHQGRFEREAQIMSRLGHPNIAAVIDFGSDGDKRYLVMELCKGMSLRDAIANGPLEPHRAVRIARQILAGLAHAHEANVVHRDLKPGNVLLVDDHGDDHVKILDFGVAKIMSADGPTELSVAASGLLGTPHYMSPEQARAEVVDSRSDLYALGIILYEMTTGQRPFDAGVGFALLRQHVEDEPKAPRELCEMSGELESVILRAMQKAREDRFQTAGEMLAALAGIPELAQPAAPPAGNRRALWSGMGVLALGALVAGGWYGARYGDFGKTPRQDTSQQAALAPIDAARAEATRVVVETRPASLEAPMPAWSAPAATVELGAFPTLPGVSQPDLRGTIDGRRFLPQFAMLEVEGDSISLRFTDRAASPQVCFEREEGETGISIPLPIGPLDATRLRSERRSEITVFTGQADSLRKAKWKLDFEEVDMSAGTVIGRIELRDRKLRLSGSFEAAYCPDPNDLVVPIVNGLSWNSEEAPEPDLLPEQAVAGAFGAREFLPAQVQVSRIEGRTTLSFFAASEREACSELGAGDIGAKVTLPDDALDENAALRVLLPEETSVSDAAHWAAFHLGGECAALRECVEPTQVRAKILSLRVDSVFPGEVRGRIYLAAADAHHTLLTGAFRADDCRSPSVPAKGENSQADAGSTTGDAGTLSDAGIRSP